jgi:fused signal recognition particle receptor
MGLFDVFSKGLQRTREALSRAFSAALGPGADPATLEALEASLLAADLGPALAAQLVSDIRSSSGGAEGARAAARAALLKHLGEAQAADGNWLSRPALAKPEVTLLLGVNGSGKTTTAGKLAQHFQSKGEKVLLGAADTFRAAAADQLELWSKRSGAALVRQSEGADPAAVAFDTVSRGVAGGFDRVIIDTAGRLQTKVNLMEELKKVHRVCGKALPGAPHQVLLVLDGTAGQNMVSQARLFHAAVPLDGLVVTKLDGTARAGAVLLVARETGVGVQLVGFGEGAQDLREFEREAYVDALLP